MAKEKIYNVETEAQVIDLLKGLSLSQEANINFGDGTSISLKRVR